MSARSASFHVNLCHCNGTISLRTRHRGAGPQRRIDGASNLQRRRRRVDGFRFPSDHDRRRSAGDAIHESTTFPLLPSLPPSALYRAPPGARRRSLCEFTQPRESRRRIPLPSAASQDWRTSVAPLSFPFLPFPLPTSRCVGSVSRQHRLLSRIPSPLPCSPLRFRPSSFIQLRLSKKAR